MGIKTKLLLSQAQTLFPRQNITALTPTDDGIMDTTYIASSTEQNYILKKYESALAHEISEEKRLLKRLDKASLLVPQALGVSQGWHLFSYIKGSTPQKIHTRHLKAVGKFLGRMHQAGRKHKSSHLPFPPPILVQELHRAKRSRPLLGKRFQALQSFHPKADGLIHGDLFPDNAKFEGSKVGVFDFIQAGKGDFSFDLGVVGMSWIIQKRPSILACRLLLHAYNQTRAQKIALAQLLLRMEEAALIYALKRFSSSEKKLDPNKMLLTAQKVIFLSKSVKYRKKQHKKH